MKIKLFENFNRVDLDITYELWTLDKNGDEIIFKSGDPEDDNYNMYDLSDMVDLFEKYESYDLNLSIRKITKEYLDEDAIERAKLEIKTKKYNV